MSPSCLSMLVVGIAMLALSLVQSTRVVRQLPPGRARVMWWVLTGLIVVFIGGYVAECVLGSWAPEQSSGYVVPAIFLLGALFVLLATTFSLEAVRSVLRVAVLETENITDPLMGIFNRRHFDRQLEAEVSRARRYGLELSVVMLDLDHFKRVNDTHGHQMGDAVLRELGEILRTSVRASDVPARYGGEEVVAVLPSTALEGARTFAERLRAAVEERSFGGEDGRTVRMTVSAGVASLLEGGQDAKALVAAADAALYRAKESGRNRVEVARAAS